jgi:hypothetical protein
METRAITFRLPLDVYENLRREAFVTRRPMNELVTESVAARYAGRHKVIHHIDGNPGNNDPANLRLMDADDHGQPEDAR